MHVLIPSLTPRGGINVRMVSLVMVRGELSHSSDVIDACTCIHNSVASHVNVCGSAHCRECDDSLLSIPVSELVYCALSAIPICPFYLHLCI